MLQEAMQRGFSSLTFFEHAFQFPKQTSAFVKIQNNFSSNSIKMSSDSVKEYAETILKQRIASICLGLGWNSTQSSPMNVSNF